MKITNKDPGFYDLLGPIFGSRKVHRETGDRFFDDDKKEWYLEVNDEKEILALISLSGETIKKRLLSKSGKSRETFKRCLLFYRIQHSPICLSGCL